jgi:hypothetical protein
MDLIKQYIVQSISAASNNLRLSTQKIEVVALLREEIMRSVNLENDIKSMKKITELSKFAIRLHEIYNFLTQPYVDFFKISDKFKEHSQYLIKDLSSLLENVSPQSFKKAIEKLHPPDQAQEEEVSEDVINVDLSKRDPAADSLEPDFTDEAKDTPQAEEVDTFESEVLEPVKPLDDFLKKLDSSAPDNNTIGEFSWVMQKNGELSAEKGFDILAAMHETVVKSLNLIASGKIEADKKTIDSIRACLIVIVAVVKDKKIDVTPFLEKAEEFGNRINNLN